MTVTNQIASSSCGVPEVSQVFSEYIGDDWQYAFLFQDADGVTQDVSGISFSANLINESPYTITAISGGNGSVDTSYASQGIVTVTVSDALTSTLTPDLDSVNATGNCSTSFHTRLTLVGTYTTITNTYAILPIRIVRR